VYAGSAEILDILGSQLMETGQLDVLIAQARDQIRLYIYPEHITGPKATVDLELTRHDHSPTHHSYKLEYVLWTGSYPLRKTIFTDDPEAADYFVVPHSLLGHLRHSPERYIADVIAPMFHRIRYESRYYNRSGGLDHLVVYATDNGPLCDCVDKSYYSLALGIDHQPLVKRMLSRMIKIGYYGQRGGASTQDCGWRDAVDIGLPMYNFFWQRERPPSWTEMLRTRTLVDVHFGGSIWGHSGRGACSHPLPSKWTPYQEQRLGPLQSGESIQFASCNPGVRTWLAEYLTQGTPCTQDGGGGSSSLPRRWARCRLVHKRVQGQPRESTRSGTRSALGNGTVNEALYNFCPAAFGCWSARLFDVIDRGGIPVVLADDIVQPFEELLGYGSFSLKLDVARLMGGDDASLVQLHRSADQVLRECVEGSQEAANCTRLAPVRMMQRSRAIAPYLSYSPFDNRSAFSLFLVELLCRKRKLQRGFPPEMWKQISCETALR